MKALSEETRLWILYLLSMHSLCVCEIMEILNITQTKASRHLIYMKNAGIVESKREDRWVVYSIRRDLSPEAAGIIKAVLKAVSSLPEAGEYKRKMEKVVSDSTFRLTHSLKRGGCHVGRKVS
ncbi:MAG: winged helix-turn-helix transcriptional regulator [Deferribacteres bacterium]|nr:winged helix-turn-helix transcriptional regulator [Deferribacteres bacterium]